MTISTDQLLAIYRSAADAKDERLLAATSRELLTRVHNSNPYLYDYPTIPEDLSAFREFPYPPKSLTQFHEQIRWMMGAHPMHLYAPFVDKRTVLDYVRARAPQLVLNPVMTTTTLQELEADLPFASMPVIAKLTNGCQAQVALPNPKDSAACHAALKRLAPKFIDTSRGLREYQYRFPPRVILQPLLDVIYEIKFVCVNGAVEFIRTVYKHEGELYRDLYNTKWEFLGSDRGAHSLRWPKPDKLDVLLGHASSLAQPFQQVRVDFMMDSKGRVFFGELTFTWRGGVSCSSLSREQSTHLAKLWSGGRDGD